jgi:hypothetical protein
MEPATRIAAGSNGFFALVREGMVSRWLATAIPRAQYLATTGPVQLKW